MNSNNSVWIVDDDRSIRWVLDKSLSKTGLITQTFENGDELLNRLTHESPDAIISDIRMPGMNGLDLLSAIQESHPSLPVIIMTAHSAAVLSSTFQNPSTSRMLLQSLAERSIINKIPKKTQTKLLAKVTLKLLVKRQQCKKFSGQLVDYPIVIFLF